MSEFEGECEEKAKVKRSYLNPHSLWPLCPELDYPRLSIYFYEGLTQAPAHSYVVCGRFSLLA
jgi:hypothetical protein